jgi:hypothetical protein
VRAGVLVLIAGPLVGLAPPARAEPYLALRSGLSCSACHVNRTGGGGRTAFGAGYGATTLPARRTPASLDLFDGALGERIRFGADGRGGYLGHVRAEGPYLGEFRLSSTTLYATVDLLPDRLTFYVDEQIAPGGAATREAFALLAASRAGGYLKAGKFFLPYGLRLQDNDAAIRRGTGFTFETADIGLEAGFDTGRWAGAAAVSNGTSGAAEQDNRKQLVASMARIVEGGRIGLAASSNDLPGPAHATTAGVFGGVHVEPVVLLVGLDRTLDRSLDGSRARGAAGHVEADVALARGVTARAWLGAFDRKRGDGERRFRQRGLGVDWTPLPGLQLRVFWRARSGPVSVEGSRDDEAVVEAHVYF